MEFELPPFHRALNGLDFKEVLDFFDDDEKFIETQITEHIKHSLLIRVIVLCMSASVWIALVIIR